MEMIFDPLMQYGALGLFCIFLITQFVMQNKKIDSQNQKFTEALEKLRSSHLDREEALRSEYQAQANLLRSENENIKQSHAEIFSQFRQHVLNAHSLEDRELILTSVSSNKEPPKTGFSSAISIFGLQASAIPIIILCFIPPDKL